MIRTFAAVLSGLLSESLEVADTKHSEFVNPYELFFHLYSGEIYDPLRRITKSKNRLID